MKKIIIFAIIILVVFSVSARENRLYFTESENRLYYESSLIDEKTFMKHTDMVPGSRYVDNLVIENGTNTKYTLYFKVEPVEQSAKADELLDYINMDIYLDNNLIYRGKAKGLDYRNEGVNLQDAIQLGEFNPSQKSNMRVETSLSTTYSDTNNRDYSKINWSFYGQYENSEVVIIIDVPKTDMDISSTKVILSIVSLVLGVFLIFFVIKKNKEQKNDKRK